MKKPFCVLIALLMLLSMTACGAKDAAAPQGLQVGYARKKIMPDFSMDIPLGGYGNEDYRLARDYLDYLYITCVSFTQDDQTVLLYTQDLIHSHPTYVAQIREALTAKTGIPGENILFAATHAHSNPEQNESEYPGIQKFNALYVEMGISAGLKALEDRAAATLYGGSVTLEGMNFVRHYLMNDGTYYGSNFGSTASGIKAHAAESDPTMRLLKIDREGEKEDIMLMNWQAHPCFTGGIDQFSVSADYIGTARNAFEQQTGMKFAFFLGAAGNITTDSKITEKRNGLDNNTYGQALAKAAIDAMPALTKLENSGIVTTHKDITYPMNKEDLDMLADAEEVARQFAASGDRSAGNALAKQYGMSSVYHANAIVNRSQYPETSTFRIHATRIGEFSFVNAPYEMFAANGIHICSNSPFQNTFIMTCSNDSQGYFPTIEAFAYGCYESYTCTYARGIAEDTADEFVELLKSIA